MAWFSLAQIKATPWSGTVGGSVKRSLAMALFGHAKPIAKAFGLDAATRPCSKQCCAVSNQAGTLASAGAELAKCKGLAQQFPKYLLRR